VTDLHGPRQLVGGIVAYRDGERVASAIRSLLRQQLPPGTEWSKIWIVVAPDEVGTAESATQVAAEDPRVEVVIEQHRRGKSAALAEVFARSRGDLLVLLNGDAEAAPGAVAALLEELEGVRGIYGIMARPVLPPGRATLLYTSLGLLWGLHDRLHRELFRHHEGTHLSDELFALPIDHLPPMREGIITDGAYAASWILSEGGELRYAPGATVRLSVPARVRDHLEQRRRILVGHWQVQDESGRPPSTLESFAFRHPGRVLHILRAEARERPHWLRSLLFLLAVESLALTLARWDIVRRRRGYAIWPRVVLAEIEPSGEPTPGGAPG
jgi:glycosyltransferase involved in cell wall biosynthesis